MSYNCYSIISIIILLFQLVDYIFSAKKLLEDHRNPIVKQETPGPKLFLKSEADEAKELTLKHLENIETTLRHIRVDRR